MGLNPSDNPKHAGHMSMPEKRKLHHERLERLPTVLEMYLKGRPIKDIAKKVGVTSQVIYKDMRYARKQWQKEIDKSATELLNHELEKINLVESEAWLAWERSCEKAVERSSEVDADGKTKNRRTVKNQAGDARFLDIARKCIDDRCKLLKIGQYSTEESKQIHARAVEVVVESTEQVSRILQYEDYDDLTKPSAN